MEEPTGCSGVGEWWGEVLGEPWDGRGCAWIGPGSAAHLGKPGECVPGGEQLEQKGLEGPESGFWPGWCSATGIPFFPIPTPPPKKKLKEGATVSLFRYKSTPAPDVITSRCGSVAGVFISPS